MRLKLFMAGTALASATVCIAQPAAPVSQAALVITTVDAKAEAKVQRAAQAAERKRQAELRRLYGAGPYPDEIDAYLATRPETLRPFYKSLFTGGERNAVLNFERLGLAAIEKGFWSDAEAAFDAALARIESVYAKNAQAEAARSLFHKEANKDFKGEPYERAMAYYYRGLLYLRAGDYDNARASFKAAEYQDSVSEAEEFQSDFAIMNYLIGWTQHCQGQTNSAAESFAIATKAEPSLAAPAPGSNLLMIAELGRGPLKARDGKQKEKMVFQAATGFDESAASFRVAGADNPAIIASSVYHQATTRGGRAIDGILAGKASWKETTGAMGQAALDVGISQMAGGSADMGMGFAAAGAIFSLFSSAMKPSADIRVWDGLPDRIALAAITAPESGIQPSVTFSSASGPLDLKPVSIMQATAGRCSIVWTRSRSAADLPAEVPGDDAGVAKSLSRKKAIQEKDKAFRIALAGQ